MSYMPQQPCTRDMYVSVTYLYDGWRWSMFEWACVNYRYVWISVYERDGSNYPYVWIGVYECDGLKYLHVWISLYECDGLCACIWQKYTHDNAWIPTILMGLLKHPNSNNITSACVIVRKPLESLRFWPSHFRTQDSNKIHCDKHWITYDCNKTLAAAICRALSVKVPSQSSSVLVTSMHCTCMYVLMAACLCMLFVYSLSLSSSVLVILTHCTCVCVCVLMWVPVCACYLCLCCWAARCWLYWLTVHVCVCVCVCVC
jgi:hypothetical protein